MSFIASVVYTGEYALSLIYIDFMIPVIKGIFQPFELRGETMLIRPAVINGRTGKFFF
jgi:hypothetical protein